MRKFVFDLPEGYAGRWSAPVSLVTSLKGADVVGGELGGYRAPVSFVMSLKVLALHVCVVAISRWTGASEQLDVAPEDLGKGQAALA